MGVAPDVVAGSSDVGGSGVSAPPFSLSAASPCLLVLLSRLVADGDAVEADRAADVETIADIPRVLPLLPIHRHPGRTQHFELLAFIEHVLLERLAVDLAALQDFLHERIELVGDWRGRSRGRFRRRLLRGYAGGQPQKAEQPERNNRGGRRTGHGCLRRAGWHRV